MASEHNQNVRAGQLFVVATPIGNLDDISQRAIATLNGVDLIACEDTRHSRKLLTRHGISTKVISYHEHNERTRANELLGKLRAGLNVALISDAGTPLIADPGYRIVSLMHEHGIRVTPIPGACSPIAALSASGLPSDRFSFLSFLPRGGEPRRRAIKEIAQTNCTIILLESPQRLLRTLKALRAGCPPPRMLCAARELTKLHEQFVRGDIDCLLRHFEDRPPRGEIVLMVAPAPEQDVDDLVILEQLAETAMQELAPSERARRIARKLGVSRARVYALAVPRRP